MKKLITVIFTSALIMIFATQLQQTFAKQNDKDDHAPITSPITSPECKPGWGFGDKNHCHFGPPGQIKHENDQGGNNDEQHESSNSAKENKD